MELETSSPIEDSLLMLLIAENMQNPRCRETVWTTVQNIAQERPPIEVYVGGTWSHEHEHIHRRRRAYTSRAFLRKLVNRAKGFCTEDS